MLHNVNIMNYSGGDLAKDRVQPLIMSTYQANVPGLSIKYGKLVNVYYDVDRSVRFDIADRSFELLYDDTQRWQFTSGSSPVPLLAYEIKVKSVEFPLVYQQELNDLEALAAMTPSNDVIIVYENRNQLTSDKGTFIYCLGLYFITTDTYTYAPSGILRIDQRLI